MDPSSAREVRGSLEDFLKNYNQIESLLAKAGQPYQSLTSATFESRQPRRISNVRLADILLRSERINYSLYERLRELITLRNAIIHGAEPIVSHDIVETSVQVLHELQSALNGEASDEP